MQRNPNKRTKTFLIVCLMLICFLLGRSFGFNEAKNAYEPVLERSQELIEKLQSELKWYSEFFDGLDHSERSKPDSANA